MDTTGVFGKDPAEFVAIEDARMLARVIYHSSGAMYPHPEALTTRESFREWFIAEETLRIYTIRELSTGMLLATGTIGLLKDNGVNLFPQYLMKEGFSLDTTVELGRLMSEPRARGNGFGKAIINSALEDFKNATVIACVNTEDLGVSNWYKQNDFLLVGYFTGKRGNKLSVYRFDSK